jgi:hypothetical protein
MLDIPVDFTKICQNDLLTDSNQFCAIFDNPVWSCDNFPHPKHVVPYRVLDGFHDEIWDQPDHRVNRINKIQGSFCP